MSLPHLRLLRQTAYPALLPRTLTRARPLAPAQLRAYSTPLKPSPAPPRLPDDQQAEFERLQREAEAKLASPAGEDTFFAKPKPEFKGDVNPSTGEVGGPKNEPLRWGGKGDWSFGGKVTDF